MRILMNKKIKQGESLNITATYDVDISAAKIEFNARLRGETTNGIDIDESAQASQFEVSGAGSTDLTISLLPADTDIAPGSYIYEIAVTDTNDDVNIQCGILTITESIS